MASSSVIEKIPVVLLTGFLGSGKSTLLAHALKTMSTADTLVLVNEIGEIGLDHDLLWAGGSAAILLENGCICCTISDDLLTMLGDLYWQRLHRKIPKFSKVIIETTGLADPCLVVSLLASDKGIVGQRYRLGGCICTVDAEMGLGAIEQFPVALAQIAAADQLILTKTDRADGAAVLAVQAALRAINSIATIEKSRCGSAGTPELFKPIDNPWQVGVEHTEHFHLDGIDCHTITLKRELSLDVLKDVLNSFLKTSPAESLLRMKGAVSINGIRHCIHSVGHQLYPFYPIEGNQDDRFIVIISRGFGREDICAALSEITEES
ncbi:MAG: GTP-binding protein [Rhizobiales bacterium]|nr:GTP-binding protein [Hyphomicrobiales bacterium]